jgi:manganese oxidase
MQRANVVLLSVTLVFSTTSLSTKIALPVAAANSNRSAAGVLRNGVLTVSLDAMVTTWYPNGDSLPGMTIEAFAERSKQPSVPGPLIRVPCGTEMRASFHNSLTSDTLTIHFPATVRGAGREADDSVAIPPGETRELRLRATRPGNYLYRGTTGPPFSLATGMRGLLVGALIVDTASVATPAHDRVFVLTQAPDSLAANVVRNPANIGGFLTFAINGRSWPNTERIVATVGDTTHWRIINASTNVHPLHLHGFYFRVDTSTGTEPGVPGRMVATQRMPAFSTMSMTWVPERPGNWIFHCHFQLHVAPDPARRMPHEENHALSGMRGLVLGVSVAPKPGTVETSGAERERRRLRLVAIQDAGVPDSAPSLRFVLEEPGGATPRLEARPGFSPTITLTRGEPVSITVVNNLHEATAVHWHGIELESYYDGVAGFSGSGNRLAPLIAPGDSFEARFTPPRSGTFMYHSHVNEVRQHRAGLVGPLIVRDAPESLPNDDQVFFIKAMRDLRVAPNRVEINGMSNPDTVVLHSGKTARLRFIGLSIFNPNATVLVTARRDSVYVNPRDTLVLRWRSVAKDGADLPEANRTTRLAQQMVSMGETYDFEITPRERGHLRIEVRAASPTGPLLARVPIRVD